MMNSVHVQQIEQDGLVGREGAALTDDRDARAGRMTEQAPARWQAVANRDRSADGVFVYAVASTGIYCRPSCPSRKPARSRVTFFDTPLEAERHGFRPCKRCHPHDSASADPWIDKIRRACAYLAHVEGNPSLAALARRVGGSPSHLQRNFKRIVGVSPREFADASRLRKMKRQLRNGVQVTAAVLEAGYGSSSRFYERAVRQLGMTPSRYKSGGVDTEIWYAIVGSPFGKLLVARTERGVCAIRFGATAEELRRGLAAEFHAAAIHSDRGRLAGWTSQVLEHLSGRLPRLDLPLDIRATAFQRQVWSALGDIPRGETRSYAEVARLVGRPGAHRAVARACAANPVALAIPCHRVVPASGGVGGYRWGGDRKRRLLKAERS